MGVLLLDRLNGNAMVRRLSILACVRDYPLSADAMVAIRETEPNAIHEYDNFPPIARNGLPIGPVPLCKLISCRVGSTRLLFVSGVYNADRGRDLWNGYVGPYGHVGFFQSPPQINTALQAFAQMNPFFIGQPDVTAQIFCGHSAGGASLFYFANDCKLLNPSSALPVMLCFGAPRAAWQQKWRENAWQNWVSVFNDDDPVPLIPPRITYWQRFWAGLSEVQGERISRFTDYPEGMQFDVLGGLTRTLNSPSNLAAPPDAIGAWLAAEAAGRNTPHSLDSYLARARLYALAQEGVHAPDTADGGVGGGSDYLDVPDPPPAPSRRVIQQVISQAQGAIISNTERGVSESSVVIPRPQVFVAYRVGRLWYVRFGNTQIALAPNKKRARGLARVGNDFLRRMQIEGEVDPRALVQQLTLYCQLAADPAGDFQPPMNVVNGG